MQRTLMCAVAVLAVGSISIASAADIPVKAPRMVVPAVAYSWSGLYIGAHIGGAWADKDWTDPNPGVGYLGSHTADGFIAGGQVGFNWQVGTWVFGAEAQFSWAGLDGSNIDLVFPDHTNETKIDYLGSVAGRVGYAPGNWLFYIKGGRAWVRDKYLSFSAVDSADAGQTRWGWMIGGGAEYGLTKNWSTKIEYNFMDFGTDTLPFEVNPFAPAGAGAASGPPIFINIGQQIHLVKFGINYRFGNPPADMAHH